MRIINSRHRMKKISRWILKMKKNIYKNVVVNKTEYVFFVGILAFFYLISCNFIIVAWKKGNFYFLICL